MLEQLTIGQTRKRVIATLVNAVLDEIGRKSHQHQLLIGPRGSGKTHVLTLVGHRLKQDARFLPLPLAEEEVASHPADLFEIILSKLSEELKTLDQQAGAAEAQKECQLAFAALRGERDDQRALDLVAGTLEAAAKALNRLLVPIVENLNNLLYAGVGLSRGKTANQQWALRKVLLEAHGFVLIAAAPSLFGEVTDPRAPFYDFFRIHQLGELPPEEMIELIEKRLAVELANETLEPALRKRLETLRNGFVERVPKLRGMLTLTGGLPRFAHLLFDLLVETDLATISRTLSRFLDEQTPYFQSRLDPRLVPQAELEVLDLLASSEGPLTPAEIAEALRGVTPNAVSTCLQRLRERGLVRPSGSGSRRNIRYDLTEPLFRVWRRFRLGRSEREQIVTLAELVALIYSESEIRDELGALPETGPAAMRRLVLEGALTRFEPRSFLALPGAETATTKDPKLAALTAQAEEEYLHGSVAKAYELYQDVVAGQRKEGRKAALSGALARFAHVALSSGHLGPATRAVEESVSLADEVGSDLGRANAIRSRGQVLFRLGDMQQALDDFQRAEDLSLEVGDDLGRAIAIRGRGEVLFRLGDNQQALVAFQRAEDLCLKVGDDLGRANAILKRGEVLFRLGDNQQALEAFQRAEELYLGIGDDLGRANAISRRGEVLFCLGDNQQALVAFQSAEDFFLKVGDNLGRANVIFSRGEILFHLGDNQQALDAFQQVEELFLNIGNDLGRANAISSRGKVLFRFGDNTQALDAFQQAEELFVKAGDDLGRANAISNRGEVVLLHLGDSQQALDAFQQAEDLYLKVGSGLGFGNCQRGKGLVAFSNGKWEEGARLLSAAYLLARKVAAKFNRDLFSQDLWARLAEAPLTDSSLARRLLQLAEPVLKDAGEESVRQDVTRFALATLASLGPETFLEMLPALEAGLPASQVDLVRPFRLAAEVETGRLPRELPAEAEEMRRTVREILAKAGPPRKPAKKRSR